MRLTEVVKYTISISVFQLQAMQKKDNFRVIIFFFETYVPDFFMSIMFNY